tara:strand:+ start:463 stop:597 length:135 start_codon:yes stop_codon:yes gene_type:complete
MHPTLDRIVMLRVATAVPPELLTVMVNCVLERVSLGIPTIEPLE